MRLVAFEPDQHGLLLSHEMGTGKTLTALLFFMNIAPGVRRLIVTRPALRFVYDAEHQKVFGTPLPRNIEIITYHELFAQIAKVYSMRDDFNPDGNVQSTVTSMAGAAVVFDEAHWIVDEIARTASGTSEDNINPLFDINTVKRFMTEPARALLMTGTPGEPSSPSFRTLVSIAAGREIIPQNPTAFMRLFTTVNRLKSVVWGYLVPLAVGDWTAVLIGMLIPVLSRFGKTGVVNGALSIQNAIYKMSKGTAAELALKELENKLISSSKLQPFLQTKEGENIVSSSDAATAPFAFSSPFSIEGMISVFIFTNLMCYVRQMRQEVLDFKSSQPLTYRDINYGKLSDVIAPFVSEYSVFDSSDNNAFPRIVRRPIIRVPYTADQFEVLTRIRLNALRPKDLASLGLTESLNASEQISDMFSVEPYLVKNLSRRVSQIPDSPGMPSEKMRRLLAEIIKDKARPLRHIVYSDLARAGPRIYKFLRHEGEKRHHNFTVDIIKASMSGVQIRAALDRFSNGEFDVMVIDAGLAEGLNLLRTRVFHIVDSPTNISDIRQVEARAVRFNSHADVPESERKVEYQYYVASISPEYASAERNVFNTFSPMRGLKTLFTSGKLRDALSHLSSTFKIWFETDAYRSVVITDYNEQNFVTPFGNTAETVVVARLNEVIKLDKTRVERSMKYAREQTTPPCCPRFSINENDAKLDPYCKRRGATAQCPRLLAASPPRTSSKSLSRRSSS